MTNAINKSSVFAVFNDVDKLSTSFTERLLALGIADRSTARPLAMEWASKKYSEELKEGQRGLTFANRDTAASRAVSRVLDVCFPRADQPTAKTGDAQAAKTSKVERLLAAYLKLEGAEKRSFKAQLAKL